MRNYYEQGDKVKLNDSIYVTEVHDFLRDYSYKDTKGRINIVDDLLDNPVGTVIAIKEGTGHLEVLYQPKGYTHSWWLPTTIIKPLNN